MKKRTLVCFLIFTLCVFHSSILDTAFGQAQEISPAQQVFEKYGATLMRADIQEVLPAVLQGLKSPDIQPLLNPETITLVVANPDALLKQFIPDIDDRFITLLKEDAELKAMLNDPLVHTLLQDPAAIDELTQILQVGVVVPPVVEPPVVPPVVEPPVEPPAVTPPLEQADPFAAITPANQAIIGKSRLGGLELNKLSGAKFVSELFESIGLPPPLLQASYGLTQDAVIGEILKQIPKGYLPKKQVQQLLASKDIRIFADQEGEVGLDRENFGNAITPMLSEVIYQDIENRTYLTSNNLNVYARVPSTDIGGVAFTLTDGRTVQGQQLTSTVFGSATFEYTFQLDESLAATNLPAWPALNTQLFSNVELLHSQSGLEGNYVSIPMQPTQGANGVVWETTIGVPSGSTYYYFAVTLAEPVELEVLDREAVAELTKRVLEGTTVQLADVISATKTYTIEKWAMPDPRNLQFADRGLLKALFTSDFQAELGRALAPFLGGQNVDVRAVVSALQKRSVKLQNILLRNTNRITTQFENAFDPMLSSVFTIPRITPETESIWTANIDSIADGNHYLQAVVYDAAGNPLDQMQGEFTVDTNAPEATLQISPRSNTGGYLNEEGVYVATAPQPGTAATLNINAGQIAGVAPGEGYLVFQEVELDANGLPESTWMPLTIDATMLASRLWDEALAQAEIQGALRGDLEMLRGLPLETVLSLLTPSLIQQYANPFLKDLNSIINIGNRQLTLEGSQVLHDVLGATVNLLNAVPLTFGDPDNNVVMPIQGEQMPLLIGDYGVRALGIDTLFNVSSHTEPTRLRVIAPEYDTAQVVSVVIGDYSNGDGDTNDPGESGAVGDVTIFSNTTENVVLTIEVTHRTIHPATVMVQYMDASGAWQNIGEFDLAENEIGSMHDVNWNIKDFDALVAAGNSVTVRAVAANALSLTDQAPVAAQIKLDPGAFPVPATSYDTAQVVSAVIGDCTGDGDTDDPYESGAVGDVTIFSNTTENVVLTIEVTHRTIHPATVMAQYMDASGAWQNIGEFDLAGTKIGSMHDVNWNVKDFDALVAAGNSVTVRAVATNAFSLTDQAPVAAEIKLDPGVCPVAVEVSSIIVDAAETTNADSGGPQGSVTVNAYTPERTAPDIVAIRFEVKQSSGTDWIDVGTAQQSTGVTPEGQEFVGVLEDLAGAAVGGKAVVPIVHNYMKWVYTVDTTQLEDTITADSPAARDASKDDDQYTVRAIAIASDGTETIAAAGVSAKLSVDNVDDVAPLGPTPILIVEDVAGVIAPDGDGLYTVGGIVDATVNSPIATFTVQPTAAEDTYASVKLVQTAADGTITEIVGEVGILKITVDVGQLENALYTFHALAVDAAGNVQTDESPASDVNVLNFRTTDVSDLVVTAVDGEPVQEPPAEPILLKSSVAVSFTVANGSLSLEDLSGTTVNGGEVPSEITEDPENTFSAAVDFSGLPDGLYTPYAVVTQRNGSVSFPLSAGEALVHLDNTPPTITIEAPLAGHTIDSLPTVHAKYHDGAGGGVDGATGTVGLVRIQPPNEADVAVDPAMLEKDETELVYTRNEQLPGGAYRVVIQVTDILGNVGEASVEFAISGTIPTVMIHAPASGQTFEHGKPLISGEFSGAGALEVTTFTLDGNDATPTVDGNRFSYTPEEELVDGDHTVAVEVTDGNGKTAQASVIFTVAMPKDTTPPIITEAGPSGLIKGDSWVTISAVVADEQSAVTSVRFGIDDKPLRSVPLAQIAQGRLEISDSFTPGTHRLKVVALSEGGSTEYSWTFTLVVDNVAPTITSITPAGTFRGGLPTISASANDESGVDEMSIVVIDSDGEEVKGSDEDDGEDDVEGITRIDFIPEAPLSEGTYTIEVRATDTIGNSATAKGSFTIDFDTAAPIITLSSPQQDARLTERRPTIAISFADAESGVDPDSIRFVLDDQLVNLAPNQKSASQVIYTPLADLAVGKHTVKLEVSDMAHQEGNVSEKNNGAREANMTVHEFSFLLEEEEGPVLAARPINAPNPFKENTRISFTLNRQSTVSIVIYDITLRPVRVLVDNEVWDAGEYIGKNAIGWDGTTTGGEDLARGIYFCQVMVADGFEPEYAILKLALTR